MTSNVSTETDVISDNQLAVVKTFTIITGILGSGGNFLTVLAILKGRFHQNPCYLFVLNLNICNLIHCLIFHPIIVVQAFHAIWDSASAPCIAFSYGLFVNLGTELWGYICITLNRYFCVVHYSIYSNIYGRKRYLVFQIIFSWIFYPVVFLLPVFNLWGSYQYASQKLLCHPFVGPNCDGFCLFVFTVALLTTLPVILYCYSAIIYTYIHSRRKIGNQSSREASVSYSTANSVNHSLTVNLAAKTDHERKKKRSELRMAFTILCVILVFGSCRLPFMILYLFDPSMTKVQPFVHTLLIYIGSCSNWINPVIYSLTNIQIRTKLKQIVLCYRKSAVLNIGRMTNIRNLKLNPR